MSKRTKKTEVPETLNQWQAKLTAYATDDLPVQQPVDKPAGNAARLIDQIQKSGLNLRIESVLHERHCDLKGVCACAVRAIVQFPNRYRRKGARHIVRLPQ